MLSQITFIDDIEDDFPKRKIISQKPQQTSQRVEQRVEQRPFTREEIEADYNEYQAYQAKMYQSAPQKQLQQQLQQQSSQIYQQIPQSNQNLQYQENKENKYLDINCLNISHHVKTCQVCGSLYKPNKTPFWIIILILIIIICFLGKRYINF